MANVQDEKHADIERMIPGVFEHYEKLQAGEFKSLFASDGSFYNHVFFARDALTSARLLREYSHDLLKSTIKETIRYQGVSFDRRSQEEPGRIHHEHRDFATWSGSVSQTVFTRLASIAWGGNLQSYTTYFATETTATFVLACKSAIGHGAVTLDDSFIDKNGKPICLRDAIIAACNWIVSVIDESGLVAPVRSSGLSLPFQTYQDSYTAYSSRRGLIANYTRPLAFIETQCFSADALLSAAKLLPEHPSAKEWRSSANLINKTVLKRYWMSDKEYFAPLLDQNKRGEWRKLEIINIAPAWILGSSAITTLPAHEQAHYAEPVLRRLFSDEMMTPIGLRSRSLHLKPPLKTVVDYHGSYTVWPVFSQLFAESLRRLELNALADEIENRVLNGINIDGKFSEYFIVTEDGAIGRFVRGAKSRYSVQMIPERTMAFTISTALRIVSERLQASERPTLTGWKASLTSEIIGTWGATEVFDPKLLQAPDVVRYHDLPLSAAGGLIKTIGLAASQIFRKVRHG